IISEPPPVQIEDVVVDNEPTVFDTEVQVPPDKENFEISYIGLSFMLPEQIRFRYKLEGLNEDWIEAGTRRTAYFSSLPPGEYIFNVTAANRDGVWNPEPARLKIVVVPAFWQTVWFRVLLVLGFVAMLFFLYTRRVSALERANATQKAFSKQLLESQENERKRIAAELHDSLSQNLVVIKNRVLLARRTIENKEKTVEQLDEISSATDEAIDEVSEISYNLRPYQLDKLGLSKAIVSMLNKVSTASGIEFAAEIDNLNGTFAPESEINIYRIVQESVNNIIKHSEATKAKVEILKTENAVSIVISDNGKGFNAEPASKSSGFGLIGIAERARILGGKYQFQSMPGGGTIVNLEIVLTPQSKN
ncbi:MAG: hypothetical protein H7Z37_16265, partial [Pyrinomonadaceae bacterium]|nr:hypothetical protein [Pyrinomonadaceae bacterium]